MMKPEDKDLKQSAELNEEELEGVAGGQMGIGPNANAQFTFTMRNQAAAKTLERQGAVHPTSREEMNKL